MCFKCGDPWHKGRCKYEGACWTWIYEMLRSDLKRCPECKIKIIKNEGCVHMSCPKCQTKFCWECKMKLGDWQQISAHDKNPFGCFMGQATGLGFVWLDLLVQFLLVAILPFYCIWYYSKPYGDMIR